MFLRSHLRDGGQVPASVQPYFFLSYAHTPRFGAGGPDPDMWVERLFRDLSSHVMALTDLPAGSDAGFMDREIRSGEGWSERLGAALATCRVFVPAMAARGYGRIVNVSSGAGQLSTMGTYAPAYSMSKAALNAFTRILAATYRDRGVLVNAADPGWVRTDMGGAAATRSVEEGADTIVWLATLPDRGPTGGFFHDRRPAGW